MSRAGTIVAVGIIILVTIWMQRVAVELLGPSSMLWGLIADVTWPVDGDAWAERMYVAISVYFMWLIRVGAVVGGFVREFRKQNVTAARRGP